MNNLFLKISEQTQILRRCLQICFFLSECTGNLSQIETLVLNVSGRILMVNKENNGNATENLVSILNESSHVLKSQRKTKNHNNKIMEKFTYTKNCHVYGNSNDVNILI